MAYFERRFRDQGNIYLYNNIGKNPYLGMLTLADTIMITNDSISMISEAAITGKPIYILKLPEQNQRKKIAGFIDEAIERKHVRYYEDSLAPFESSTLNEVARITPKLRSLLSL